MIQKLNKLLDILIPLLSGVSISSLNISDSEWWRWSLPLAVFCCGLKFIFIESKIK